MKGVGDSLWVTLDPALPAEQLQKELQTIFSRLKHLAINARVVLDPGDGKEHPDLIAALGGFLKETFDVGMVTAATKKRKHTDGRARTRELHGNLKYRRSNVLMVSGRVRSGQKLEAGKHLVLLGDVNPGGAVVAGGDIFVLGCLRGTASAGQPDDESAIILALDFKPSQIQIGGYVAAGLPPAQEKTAEFARVENGTVLVEDYLAADPFGRIPWPEIR